MSLGGIEEREMFNTFNMGVGMTLTMPQAQAERAIAKLNNEGVEAYCIGEVIKSEEGLTLC
jgi:phosphoribosylformylglycinamidine cyclo-ligase